MSKDKGTTAPEMPKEVDYRSGCKVCWRYYKTEAEAKIASDYARKEGYEQAARGYDFGFCSPGSVSFIDPAQYPNSPRAGLYEVCFA